jgi:hypothetical protein
VPLVLVLGRDDPARVRFAVSPIWETMTALRVLREPHRRSYHLPWLDGTARPRRLPRSGSRRRSPCLPAAPRRPPLGAHVHGPLKEALVGAGRAEALITVSEVHADGPTKGSSRRQPLRTNVASPKVSNRQARPIVSSAPCRV